MSADTDVLERAAAELDTRLHVDPLEHLEWDPKCEGEYHLRGLQGHEPDQPATFYLIAPCHGPRLMICAGRRAWLATRGTLRCTHCRVEWLIERWTVVPIDGKG